MMRCTYCTVDSAFIQGSSDLHEQLQAYGIKTVVVCGTATNVCCDSTARDGMFLDYEVIMVSDGCAAGTDEEHSAALLTFLLLFGDVMTADEVIATVQQNSKNSTANAASTSSTKAKATGTAAGA